MEAAAGQAPGPVRDPGGRSPGRRGAGPCPRRGAGRARGRDPPGGHGGRADRDPLRARARPRREGRPGDQPPQGHRLRHGLARRAHPGPHPGPPGHRRRGAQRQPPGRRPGRHPRLRGGAAGQAPARGGRRPRHQRPGHPGQPGHHAPRAHRRGHRRGQVVVHQLAHHLGADALDARSGAHDPRRPQARRAGPVQQAAPPADPGGDQPEEGSQRARRGPCGRWNGATTC